MSYRDQRPFENCRIKDIPLREPEFDQDLQQVLRYRRDIASKWLNAFPPFQEYLVSLERDPSHQEIKQSLQKLAETDFITENSKNSGLLLY
ncbi:hypothetical protein N7488_007408 [Penicillium malachiteum]|nr:hypothetical protein N7488_007408 [Penicillium malachiteum]